MALITILKKVLDLNVEIRCPRVQSLAIMIAINLYLNNLKPKNNCLKILRKELLE